MSAKLALTSANVGKGGSGRRDRFGMGVITFWKDMLNRGDGSGVAPRRAPSFEDGERPWDLCAIDIIMT